MDEQEFKWWMEGKLIEYENGEITRDELIDEVWSQLVDTYEE